MESGLSILDNAIVPLWEFKVHWTMQPINCACVLHEITCCVKAVILTSIVCSIRVVDGNLAFTYPVIPTLRYAAQ